jgi:hypothetical protein
MTRNSLAAILLVAAALPAPAQQQLSNHRRFLDRNGILQPWTSWRDTVTREVDWYLKCPLEHGYPRFVTMTFMDGNYKPIEKRPSFIPATQNGMGIISYLKYNKFTGGKDPRILNMARLMGDYLVKESNTPDEGRYPRFTRSTGWRDRFPQPPDCGSQNDKPYEMEPDKGGIAGYALVMLYAETKDSRYLDQALQNARVLVRNMSDGDATHGPWPFRVDYRTGEGRGAVSGNTAYVLRLFDELIARGNAEFKVPRERLWRWIRDFQIPNADAKADGLLWVQFFEDHEQPDNRTAWSPLNLARYLIERKEALDPEWQKHSRALIDFVLRRFTGVQHGVFVCGEQDYDRNGWGGINSTFAAVLAMYSAATRTDEFKGLAWQAMNFTLYAVDQDGCPLDGSWRDAPGRGGWQEDAHTDKLHNVLDAIAAYPEWGR